MTDFSLRHFLLNNATDYAAQLRATQTNDNLSSTNKAKRNSAGSQTARVQSYYAEASEGYRDWSRKLNMHFGTYERGINPFDLEAMLENTNRHVLKSLSLQGDGNALVDLGCGLGGTMRYAAKQAAIKHVTGVTIAANQVQEAEAISVGHLNEKKLRFINANYHEIPLKSESFEGAYAIESACHSNEPDKASLLKEAYRLLKPGGTFTMCDGFLKTQHPMNPLARHCYNKTCKHWALGNFPELMSVVTAMKQQGYTHITIKDLSWRVLPSALYIPWMVAKYGTKLLWHRDRNPEHWNHLLAPAWGLALACNRKHFGYYRVSGTRPEGTE